MKIQRYQVVAIVLIGTGLGLLAMGLALKFMIPVIMKKQIDSMLPLTADNSSQIYQQWQKPSLPVYMQFYFFDLKNPEEVDKGKKPVLEQIGPYTYQEYRHKEKIDFHDGNNTVSYVQPKSYVFRPDMSAGKESDEFTNTDMLKAAIVDMVSNKNGFEKFFISGIIDLVDQKTMFRKSKVSDMLWGYKTKTFNALKGLVKTFGIKANLPPSIGLFAGQNGTNDGTYTVVTGTGGTLDHYQSIKEWNKESSLTIWHNEYANRIEGTDGSFFAPYLNKKEELNVFVSDLCRTVGLSFEEETDINGIGAYRYKPPAFMMANSTVNPKNKGFCSPKCLPAGIMNLAPCKKAPVFMSQPHFYQAAQSIIDGVSGVNPTDECTTIMNVEPHTGIVLSAQKKLQLNFYLDKVDGMAMTDNLKGTYLPMVFMNESVVVDESSADKLYDQLVKPVRLGTIGGIILMAIGSFFILAGLILLIACAFKQSSDKPDNIEIYQKESSINGALSS